MLLWEGLPQSPSSEHKRQQCSDCWASLLGSARCRHFVLPLVAFTRANQLRPSWPRLFHSSALFYCALNPSFFIAFFLCVCNTSNQVAITLFSKRIGISLLGHCIRGQFKLHRKQAERGIFSAPGDAYVTANTLADTQEQTRTLQMPKQCSCDVLLFPTD